MRPGTRTPAVWSAPETTFYAACDMASDELHSPVSIFPPHDYSNGRLQEFLQGRQCQPLSFFFLFPLPPFHPLTFPSFPSFSFLSLPPLLSSPFHSALPSTSRSAPPLNPAIGGLGNVVGPERRAFRFILSP